MTSTLANQPFRSQKASSELLLYLDPGFLEDTGHYRNFADSIHAEAARRGIEVWHISNNLISKESVDRFHLLPLFQHKAILSERYRLVEKLRSLKHSCVGNSQVLTSFSRVLGTVLRKVAAEGYRKTTLYMYTSHTLYLPEIAKIINSAEFSGLGITAHLDLFYLNQDFCLGQRVPGYERMLKRASALLERHDRSGLVHLYSDSSRVIDRYQPFFTREIGLLPIPLANVPVDISGAASAPADKNVRLGFFGYAHEKQGYQLMKQLYDRMVKAPEFSNVVFTVRHNVKFATRDTESLVKSFKNENVRIKHLNGSLGKDLYYRELAECDAVLIPHSRRYYPCQTSGTLIDALALNKLVVVPKDTWLADEVNRYQAGVTFDSDNFDSFFAAVRGLLSNLEAYKASRKNTSELLSFNSAASLLDTIEVGGNRAE